MSGSNQEKATILWVDEAGFYLLPMAVRTLGSTRADASAASQTHA